VSHSIAQSASTSQGRPTDVLRHSSPVGDQAEVGLPGHQITASLGCEISADARETSRPRDIDMVEKRSKDRWRRLLEAFGRYECRVEYADLLSRSCPDSEPQIRL